jgi:hypothetical protein
VTVPFDRLRVTVLFDTLRVNGIYGAT